MNAPAANAAAAAAADASTRTMSLAPLGAGDLIDRAVRLYRSNFWTFVWIASPPIILGTVFTIGWTILGRELFSFGSSRNPDDYVLSWLFTSFGNLIIWFIEAVAVFSVMGGASRNFVRHLLFGEPINVRETYRNTWSRLPGLILASVLITFLLGLMASFVFYIGMIVAVLLIVAAVYVLSFSDFLSATASLLLIAATTFGAGWIFFLVASRFAYVPQVMLVEGQGVFSAIGRSANLASGNVKRLYALFIFTLLATYSALALFYVPLGWYAYLNGIQFFSYDPDVIPAWYTIASQAIWQASLILLMPVWMIGLCLLYVDERVRHEGYDIELMAARRLGEIPALPQNYANPLQPALAMTNLQSSHQQRHEPKSPFTTLGLN
ncbi:MAG: hypothetical protein M3384_17930 [Acidobacteriota bacterium]|nr:hypothetical protein [Acidobacteriota bacterium]